MLRKLFWALLLACFLFSIPQKAFAALYINEFSSNGSSDWVEIYNSDSSSVDLTQYRLRDSTASNKVDLTDSIGGNGFASFDFSDNLNNGGDTIKLVLKSDDSVVNQVVYGVPGDVSAPASGQTAGRSPDGSSNWVILSSASRGSTNNSTATVPTPTLTPTEAPTPTKTPTPTKSPTNAPSATPTKVPTAAPTKSTGPTTLGSSTNVDDPTPTNDPNSNLQIGSDNKDNVFGSGTPAPTESKGEVLGASTFNSIPWVFIGLGLIFLIVCGILAYLQFGEKILPKILKRNGQNID